MGGEFNEVSVLSWTRNKTYCIEIRRSSVHTRTPVLGKREHSAVLYQAADRIGITLLLCKSVTGSWDMRDTTNWILLLPKSCTRMKKDNAQSYVGGLLVPELAYPDYSELPVPILEQKSLSRWRLVTALRKR